MTAVAIPSVVVRPIEDADRRYIWSTARAMAMDACGGPFAHRPTVERLVDAILQACQTSETRVAQLSDESDILGWSAAIMPTTIQFFYLRRSLVNERRLNYLASRREEFLHGSENLALTPAVRANYIADLQSCQDQLSGELRMASQVAAALLPPAPVVLFRRAPKWWMLEAAALSGCSLSVVPEAL